MVQVEKGYFDFATPFFATDHEEHGVPEALQKKRN